MKNRLGLIFAVGMSLGVAACDTDYGSIDKDPYPVNVPIGGVWEGSFTYQPPTPTGTTTAPAAQPVNVILAASETNEFWIVESNTVTNCVHIGYGNAYSKQTAIAGSYGWGGNCAEADGTSKGTGTFSGAAVLHKTLTLSITENTELGNEYAQFAPDFAFDTFYLKASSLAAVAGNYTDTTGAAISIDGNGTITGATLGTCSAAATISLLNTSYNLYRVTYTLSGCTATGDLPLNGITMTGLGYIDATPAFNLVLHGTDTNGNGVLSGDTFTPN